MAINFSRWLGLAASKTRRVRGLKDRMEPRRSLLMESLEQRNLLAVTPIELGWKTIDFTATGNMTGSLKGGYIPAPYVATVSGPVTVTNGTIKYVGQAGVGTADVKGTMAASVAGRPAGSLSIDKTGQEVVENNGQFTMQLGDATSTPLTGKFNTKDFSVVATTTLEKTNAKDETASGPGTWRGVIKPTNLEPFDVIVNSVTPDWAGRSVTVDFSVTGPAQKAATRTTPVASVTLAWCDASGKVVGKISDKIGVLWNQQAGKYTVSDLPTPPKTATQLLLKAVAGKTVLDQRFVQMPSKPKLTITDVEIDEPQPGGIANAVFTVTLDRTGGYQFAPVTLKYKTVNGTAKGGSDFTPKSGTLTFAVDNSALTSTLTITVPIKRDKTETLNLVEQFTVQLSAAAYATIEDGIGIGRIASKPVVTV